MPVLTFTPAWGLDVRVEGRWELPQQTPRMYKADIPARRRSDGLNQGSLRKIPVNNDDAGLAIIAK
eukprot:43957-Eustigmatos_ZCMA.PRE.1